MAKRTMRDGFLAGDVKALTGLSGQRVHYWVVSGLIAPTGAGEGKWRRWSFTDLVALRVLSRLRRGRVSLQSLRAVVAELRRRKVGASASAAVAGSFLVAYEGRAYMVDGERTVRDVLSGQGAFPALVIDVGREIEDLRKGARKRGIDVGRGGSVAA